MTTFKKLQENNNIQELIKSTFDADLPVAGNWGYTKENATIIEAVQNSMPLSQLEHMVTSIRAHLEMNITQEKEHRYGGINANERAREEIRREENIYHKVTYEITAIKEDIYNTFIKEYKEGYGKENFDISKHFKERKEATLTRGVVHYFEVNLVQ